VAARGLAPRTRRRGAEARLTSVAAAFGRRWAACSAAASPLGEAKGEAREAKEEPPCAGSAGSAKRARVASDASVRPASDTSVRPASDTSVRPAREESRQKAREESRQEAREESRQKARQEARQEARETSGASAEARPGDPDVPGPAQQPRRRAAAVAARELLRGVAEAGRHHHHGEATYVYVVRPVWGGFFKFGITGDWRQRSKVYQCCFAEFDHHVVRRDGDARACELRIQSAMRDAGALLSHRSGLDSEVALLGSESDPTRHYARALEILVAGSPSGQPDGQPAGQQKRPRRQAFVALTSDDLLPPAAKRRAGA